MELGGTVFLLYIVGALVVGIFILREVEFETKVLQKKGTKLGPTYWGAYEGTDVQSDESMKTIDLPKPVKDSEGVAGGRGYSSGKAVKSGRV